MHPRPLIAAFGLIALNGCAALSALGGGEPLQGYELRGPAPLQAARALDRHLTVEVPDSSGALMTDRVLIRPTGIEASYLPGAQWTNDAPLMVQTLLVRALQGSGGFSYVGREPLGLSGDYAVLTELSALEGRITAGAEGETVEGIVEMRVSVVRESDARVMGTKTIRQTRPAASDAAADVTAALDLAMQSAVAEATRFVLATAGPGVSG